jgi:hypothetical protein
MSVRSDINVRLVSGPNTCTIGMHQCGLDAKAAAGKGSDESWGVCHLPWHLRETQQQAAVCGSHTGC